MTGSLPDDEALRKLKEIHHAAEHGSDRLAQTTLDSLSTAIAILAGDGTILAVNQAWRQFAAENPPILQNVAEGANYLNVCDEAVGEEVGEAQRAASGIRAVAAGTLSVFTLEYACDSPDEQRWFNLRVTPFPGDGPARVVVAHENITERKKAEEKTARLSAYNRLLLESAAEGIYGIDRDGNCTFINNAATQLLGFTTNEVLGQNMHALIHHSRNDGSPYPVEECPIYRLFKIGLPCHEDTEVLWRKNGTSFFASYSSYPMTSADGMIGSVVTFTDITERKRAEQEKEKLLDEAEKRADSDPLTGLLNHRAFYHRLDTAAARALREHTTFAVVMLDLDNFKFFNDVYGHATGDKVLRLVASKLQASCRPSDTLARFGGDELALLISNVGTMSVGEIEAQIQSSLQGIVYTPEAGETPIPITISLGTAIFPAAGTDYHDVLRQADERLRWSKTGGGEEENAQRLRTEAGNRVQGFSMLDALVTAVDNKDRYTRRHSEDVMAYSLMIARELAMTEKQQQTVALAALLHDVGKIGIPDSILRKPGKLTEEEFEAVRQHPQMGAIIVQAVPGLEDTLDAVRHHHERWDGGGYPFGLQGKNCPLIARLMAVADAFSAMTTDRPYRQGMNKQIAVAILEDGAGTQWDPECVHAFLTALSRQECLALV